MTQFRAHVVALASLITVACGLGGLFGPGSDVNPALIISGRDTMRIVAPDTVTRGVPFDVSFLTFGGGCTHSAVRTDVAITGSDAEIRPYDRTTKSDACTADLRFLAHAAQVRFDTPGTAVLHVMGRTSTGGGSEPAELRRLVTVR